MDARELLDRIGLVDGVALVVLVLFFIRGIFKGFVWQLAGLLAVVGGLAAGKSLAAAVAPGLRKVFPALTEENNLDLIAAYFGIFLVVSLGVLLLAKMLKTVIDELKLDTFDRALGGVFGVVKAAALIVTVVFFVFVMHFPRAQERIASARTGKWASQAIERGGVLFPEPLKDRIKHMFLEPDSEPAPGEQPDQPSAGRASTQQPPPAERREGRRRRAEDQNSGDGN